MISTKDLSYIKDMFNWNDTIIHKMQFYLENCDDKDLCKCLTKTQELCENNNKRLLKLLESGVEND